MAQTPEGAVKKAVQVALRKRGVVAFSDVLAGKVKPGEYIGFYYMPVAGRFSVLGIHDFVGCVTGRFFTIETKAPDNPDDATHHQERFQMAVQSSGGLSFTGVRDASVVDALFEQLEGTHADQA